MKTISYLILLTLLFSLSGCSGKEKTEMINPMKQYDSAEGFSKLGFTIDAPDGSENINYHTIADTTAQVKFSVNDTNYCYRASKAQKDIAGIYEEFEEEIQSLDATRSGQAITIEIKQSVNGTHLASWNFDSIQYTLSTSDKVDHQDFMDMSKVLAEKL